MNRIIKNGVLKKRTEKGIEKKLYHMKLVGTDYLSEIIELQDAVVKNISNKEIFQPDSKEFFIEELKKGAKIIGVFSEEERERLVAYRFITLPKGDSMNLGMDLGLSPKELKRVGHLETTLVHPNYRGNGLQRKTLFVALDLFKYLGHNHICSTISPKNFHSLNNVMAGGLVIKNLKEKYGGKMRFILHRDLHDMTPKNYIKTIDIDDINIVKKERILEKGFEGFSAYKNNIGFAIKYGAVC